MISVTTQVYVGTYSDGTAVYLLTETIQKQSKPTGCSCTVRAGRDYLDYRFFWRGDMLYYRNSEGYSGHIDDSASPVASNVYYYIRNYLER